ncbi:MAG: glycoside hydrolase family 97 N-terminal domain-containing protein, partial [Phycisphaerales bacterium]
MSRFVTSFAIVATFLSSCTLAANKWTVSSPGGNVAIAVQLANEGCLRYEVTCDGKTIVASSALGLIREDERFLDDLTFVSASRTKAIDETYTMLRGKRRICRDRANEQMLKFKNANGAQIELILRSYDDGVAFRYRFGEQSSKIYTIVREVTEFALPRDGRVWMHPYDEATEYTPAYETYYVDAAKVGTTSVKKAGWAFPVL